VSKYVKNDILTENLRLSFLPLISPNKNLELLTKQVRIIKTRKDCEEIPILPLT